MLALGLALLLLLALLWLAELALRSILFGRLSSSGGAARLRVPTLYVRGTHRDDYWKLRALLRPGARSTPRFPDAHLGWMRELEPGTYAHPDEALLAGRRPILLYGDSNAQCMTPRERCFESLLKESDLGAQYALLNYGVGGYGLDQIYLLLRATLDRFAERDPIVIVSLMIDDDLERSMLSFREWPKPRFGLVDGRLVEPEPVLLDGARFLERDPPRIESYLGRLLLGMLRGSPASGERTPAEVESMRALNGALLAAIRDELERRALRYFFFLFYFEGGLHRSAGAAWSEDLVLEFLERERVPYVSMKDFLEVVLGPRWEGFEELSGKNDPLLQNHFGDAGNRLAFEAMRQGIEGRFGNFDFERVRSLAEQGVFSPGGEQLFHLQLFGRSAQLRSFGKGPCMRAEGNPIDTSDVVFGMRAGSGGATLLRIELGSGAKRLRAKVRGVPVGSKSCLAPSVSLWWRSDEGEWARIELGIGGQPADLDIPLAGARVLELRVEYEGDDPECAWVSVRGASLE